MTRPATASTLDRLRTALGIALFVGGLLAWAHVTISHAGPRRAADSRCAEAVTASRVDPERSEGAPKRASLRVADARCECDQEIDADRYAR